jgi:hypothetical protein
MKFAIVSNRNQSNSSSSSSFLEYISDAKKFYRLESKEIKIVIGKRYYENGRGQ